MDLKGWDIILATKLSKINEKFKENNQHLSQSINYTTDAFGASISYSGNLGTWEIEAAGSNKFIKLNIPISNISYQTSNKNITGGSATVHLQVDLTYLTEAGQVIPQVSSTPPAAIPSTGALKTTSWQDLLATASDVIKSIASKLVGDSQDQAPVLKGNLCFNFNDNGDGNTGNSTGLGSSNVSAGLEDVSDILAEITLACLIANKDKFRYSLADVVLHNFHEDWLSPRNVGFGVPTTTSGESYFCIYGSAGLTEGELGGFDPTLFSPGDDIFMAVSGPTFLERVIKPGLEKSMSGAHIVFASPSLHLSNYTLPSVKVGLINYTPVISLMTINVKGDQLIVTTKGTCDMKAGISMAFTQISKNKINFDHTNRLVSITEDPSPSFSHNEDLGVWKYLSVIPVGLIATGIAALVVTILKGSLADAIQHDGGNTSGTNFKTQSMKWTNVDFASISGGGLADAFYIQGKST